MANFYNPKYDTSELINFTENTVQRASFQQIQEALTNKLKEIYGNDIDLNSTTADGQLVMAKALLIDKMFEVIVNLQQSLNPSTARGNFLDVVCAFNNVFRKGQSYSKVQCYVKPINSSISTAYEKTENGYTWQEIKCVDPNSNIWTWKEYKNVDGSYNTYFGNVAAYPTVATSDPIPCSADLSEDESVDSGKTYYTRVENGDGAGRLNDGTYKYTVVSEPTGNPHENEYYEVSFIGINKNTAREGYDYYQKSVGHSFEPGYLVDEDGYQYTLVTGLQVYPGNDNPSPINTYYLFPTEASKGANRGVDGFSPLTFTCEKIGAINANQGNLDKSNPKESSATAVNGDVGKTIDINRYPFKVWQVDEVELGDEIESDESLRTRRELEIGNQGTTVLSGLEGALRQIAGIKDVKIINNFSDTYYSTNLKNVNGGDDVRIVEHCVYVIIRYEKDIQEENIKPLIAQTILNKLTPGVSTTFTYESGKTSPLYGEKITSKQSYDFDVNAADICWKKCTYQKYPIQLKLLINSDFKPEHKQRIEKAIKEYTYNVKLNEKLTIGGLVSAINQSCIPVNGVNPYIALNGSINLGAGHTQEQYAENHLSYFDYSASTFTYTVNSWDEPNYTETVLTISA